MADVILAWKESGSKKEDTTSCVFVWVCICVLMHVEVRDQCQANYSVPYFLRPCLSLNLELTSLARQAAQ